MGKKEFKYSEACSELFFNLYTRLFPNKVNISGKGAKII